jgi:hypothetical protein
VSGLVKAFDFVLMAAATGIITDIIFSGTGLWGRARRWVCLRTIALARNFRRKNKSHNREQFSLAVHCRGLFTSVNHNLRQAGAAILRFAHVRVPNSASFAEGWVAETYTGYFAGILSRYQRSERDAIFVDMNW